MGGNVNFGSTNTPYSQQAGVGAQGLAGDLLLNRAGSAGFNFNPSSVRVNVDSVRRDPAYQTPAWAMPRVNYSPQLFAPESRPTGQTPAWMVSANNSRLANKK